MTLSSLFRFIPGTRQLALKKFVHTLNQEMIPLEIIDTKGRTWATAPKDIRHRLFIKDSRFFNALFSPDAYSLGQAYIKGYFDISGNIKELYEMVCTRLLGTDQPRGIKGIFSVWVMVFFLTGSGPGRKKHFISL
ncbi:MAG: hypothetical protein HUN05_15860 [Desulfobacter sp.]|nr:MAG: hypothetical protein HUN05_15860 [Desulfobacter sp.]